jgi:antitoxin CcdA
MGTLTPRVQKKRAVNLFVDSYLLDEAKRLGINVSETLERRLRSIVRAEQERRWLEENRDAFASINSFIDRHGLLSSRLRYRSDGR